jgi:P-type E1-E2 ATPase
MRQRQHFCTSALTLTRAEAKALTAMDSLRGVMASSCHVVRGGQERVMEPALLVPGDIVRLRLGERVPADVRVTHPRLRARRLTSSSWTTTSRASWPL